MDKNYNLSLIHIYSWGKKEVKDWGFVRDKSGNIVIDESHPNWWQDKKKDVYKRQQQICDFLNGIGPGF